MRLQQFLDPDRRWFAWDKYQHGVSFFVAGFVIAWWVHVTLPLSIWQIAGTALVICEALGFVYELGQADVAYSAKLLGQAGYGISPLDLAWDTAGAMLGIGLWLLL